MALTEQEIINYLDKAPALVQDAVTDPANIRILVSIGTRAGMHTDQIGTLAELNRNMLLGLIAPPEFLSTLAHIGIPETLGKEIMQEINQKIFIPLHEKMRAANSETQISPDKPAPPPAPRYVPENEPTAIIQEVQQRTQSPAAPAQVSVPASVPIATSIAPQPPVAPKFSTAAQLPPKIALPTNVPTSSKEGVSAAVPAPSINKLEGRTLPPPVYDPNTARRMSTSSTPPPPSNLPTSQPPAPPSTPRTYSTDPYREPLS